MKPQVEHVKGFLWEQHVLDPKSAEKLFSTMDKAIERYGRTRDVLGSRQFMYFGPTPKQVLAEDLLPPPSAMNYVSIGEKHRPMSDLLYTLRGVVSNYARAEFDFVVAQRYGDFEHVGYHADSGVILGPRIDDIVVAILSLGGSRWFSVREIGASEEKMGFEVAHGDLVIMRGKMQNRFEHALFPAARPGRDKVRISLSFLAYPKDSWSFRSKQLYSLMDVRVDRGDRGATCLVRGTKETCARRLRSLSQPEKTLMIVGPDMLPTHIRFGKGFSAALKKNIIKQYPKAKVEG